MKTMLITGMAVLAMGLGTSTLLAAKGAPKVTKADKQAARTEKPTPLLAQIVKVEGEEISVRTRPLTGPDGLIVAQDKTYAATPTTTVQVNGEAKTVADLIAGEIVRLDLSTDGKTVQKVDARLVTPADRAAKKAQRQAQGAAAATVAPMPEAGKTVP